MKKLLLALSFLTISAAAFADCTYERVASITNSVNGSHSASTCESALWTCKSYASPTSEYCRQANATESSYSCTYGHYTQYEGVYSLYRTFQNTASTKTVACDTAMRSCWKAKNGYGTYDQCRFMN